MNLNEVKLYVLDISCGCPKHSRSIGLTGKSYLASPSGRIAGPWIRGRGVGDGTKEDEKGGTIRNKRERRGGGRGYIAKEGDSSRTAGSEGDTGRIGTGEREEHTLSLLLVHTLVVTPTSKVLAFVKVHRRLSGSSAPRARRRRRHRRSVPKPAGFSPRSRHHEKRGSSHTSTSFGEA